MIGLEKTLKPGEEMLVPLRWNNPHASEMEVNIWIHDHTADGGKQPIVVPIRKPSCSGEGHQDNVVAFTVPEDFTKLGSKIPGFKGCTEDSEPMCVVQIYSHSVESRQYAIGFPIIIPGHDESTSATATTGIQAATKDPWLDISSLRDICLPATDPDATIKTAVPRWARLVSDVYNHAYQNSDYSPYSGQQQELISKNLQASAVNKMEVGNRGELGKIILSKAAHDRLKKLRSLESKIYKNYEGLANKIIKSLETTVKNTGAVGVQKLANCFRCAEVGSTNTKRLQTNTYIPSFQLPKEHIAAARKLVPSKYSALINEGGLVQIYVSAMKDLLPFYYESRNLGLIYQDAILKTTTGTMVDAAYFKKRDAENKTDGGKYAALEAKKTFVADRGCPSDCLFVEPKWRGLKEGQTRVAGDECRADDCYSHADCPSGTYVIKCESSPLNAGDGVHLTPQRCTARGRSNRESIRAIATCSAEKTTVVESNKLYLDNQEVSAACPAGQSLLYCNCHSPWSVCPFSSFAGSGSVCKQRIRRSGGRRRGVETGAGAKMYALCTESSLNSASASSQPSCKWTAHTRKYSAGYAAGVRSRGTLDWAKEQCLSLGDLCKAVTCRTFRSWTQCTVRGSTELKYSRSGETTYVASCAGGDGVSIGIGTPEEQGPECKWDKQTSKSSGGYAGRISTRFDLKNAQKKCLEMGDSCKAVTCNSGGVCTLRASSHLRPSRHGETSYVASLACQLGVPEDSVMKAIVPGSFATNVAGSKCHACVQFFGKEVHEFKEPPVSKLAKSVIKNGEPKNQDQLPDNPDGAGLDHRADRRRRRDSLAQKSAHIEIQEHKKDKGSNDYEMVRYFLESWEPSPLRMLDDVDPLPDMGH
jgi:hypothetical protein